MKTDEANPLDWLAAGKARLRSADRLYEVEGCSAAVIELLQEAAERYLKAFLLTKNWSLVRTHDLNHLLAEAAKHDARFIRFAAVAQSLTEQFWEQHYPGGDLTEVGCGYDKQHQAVREMTRVYQGKLCRRYDIIAAQQRHPRWHCLF